MAAPHSNTSSVITRLDQIVNSDQSESKNILQYTIQKIKTFVINRNSFSDSALWYLSLDSETKARIAIQQYVSYLCGIPSHEITTAPPLFCGEELTNTHNRLTKLIKAFLNQILVLQDRQWWPNAIEQLKTPCKEVHRAFMRTQDYTWTGRRKN